MVTKRATHHATYLRLPQGCAEERQRHSGNHR